MKADGVLATAERELTSFGLQLGKQDLCLDLILYCSTILHMNSKQRKTLAAIFSDPVNASIAWSDIESLLMACGAQKYEGRGSRVRFAMNGILATFHRPHPEPTTDKGAVKSVRRFLENAGVKP